jgi:hypothetical protein
LSHSEFESTDQMMRCEAYSYNGGSCPPLSRLPATPRVAVTPRTGSQSRRLRDSPPLSIPTGRVPHCNHLNQAWSCSKALNSGSAPRTGAGTITKQRMIGSWQRGDSNEAGEPEVVVGVAQSVPSWLIPDGCTCSVWCHFITHSSQFRDGRSHGPSAPPNAPEMAACEHAMHRIGFPPSEAWRDRSSTST